MQQWHPPYAAGHFVPCTGFTMLWHRDDRHFAYTPPRIEFCIIMGSHLFLHIGVLFPGNGYESGIAGIEQLFPLRHYFLIYVDQALNGYSMAYSWSNYMALLIFMLLPFFVVHRLKEALIYYKYMP